MQRCSAGVEAEIMPELKNSLPFVLSLLSSYSHLRLWLCYTSGFEGECSQALYSTFFVVVGFVVRHLGDKHVCDVISGGRVRVC